MLQKNYPLDQILRDIMKGVSMRSQVNDFCKYSAFISWIEPKTTHDALLDERWFISMKEEPIQFKRNDVWDLVPCPSNKTIICTRWGV